MALIPTLLEFLIMGMIAGIFGRRNGVDTQVMVQYHGTAQDDAKQWD